MMRYDAVNSNSDRINGLASNPALHRLLPSTGRQCRPATAITPGVQFLIHANIKASFEYQFRPSQSVVIRDKSRSPVCRWLSIRSTPIQPSRVWNSCINGLT